MKKIFILAAAMLISFSGLAADSAATESVKITEGKQYVSLVKTPSPEKEVIEFFSFYCSACYLVETKYHLPQLIKQNLPQDAVMKKYHIESFGGLSKDLSEAWAIANVLDITDQVSEALFNGIQKDKNINTADDIKEVFVNLGISSQEYDEMKSNFLVQAFLSQQSAAFNQLKPSSVPSFYVNGKYQIIGSNLDQSSEEAVIKDHSRVINYLIDLDEK